VESYAEGSRQEYNQIKIGRCLCHLPLPIEVLPLGLLLLEGVVGFVVVDGGLL